MCVVVIWKCLPGKYTYREELFSGSSFPGIELYCVVSLILEGNAGEEISIVSSLQGLTYKILSTHQVPGSVLGITIYVLCLYPCETGLLILPRRRELFEHLFIGCYRCQAVGWGLSIYTKLVEKCESVQSKSMIPQLRWQWSSWIWDGLRKENPWDLGAVWLWWCVWWWCGDLSSPPCMGSTRRVVVWKRRWRV